MTFQVLDIAEGLLHLDPIRTYPQRSATLVSKLTGAIAYRLDIDGQDAIESDPPPARERELSAFPLRNGRRELGTLYLEPPEGADKLGAHELRLARWGVRVLARGICYARRLATEGGRRNGENVESALERAPLTPRERDVVSLLVSGSSTRDIASKTSLTIATVNTYLKRIFSKLGVHSRVELIARVAGTDSGGDRAQNGGEKSTASTESKEPKDQPAPADVQA